MSDLRLHTIKFYLNSSAWR